MHVDRKLLYTSLEERIKYLHSFLDFNSSKLLPWTTLESATNVIPPRRYRSTALWQQIHQTIDPGSRQPGI